MAGGKKAVAIMVGEEESTVEIGGARVEISGDGNKVTAYTNGVETRAAPAAASSEATQISVSKGFNSVVLNGVTIEQATDGHLVITAPGTVFMKSAVGNDSVEPNPGDRMSDGTIYAGISPHTGKQMYTTPSDAPLTLKWKRAMIYAAGLDTLGHEDWRVPTRDELNVLCQNRAAIGGFDESGLEQDFGWYWSSTEYMSHHPWSQRFSDGYQDWGSENLYASLRCVR